MNSHRSHLIVASLLLILVVAACSFSSTSNPAASTVAPAVATNPPASVATATNPPANGGCTNPFFPTSSGSAWTYSSQGGALGAYTFTRTVADVSDSGFTLNDQTSLANGTSTSVKWNCQNGNLAALDAGSGSLNVSSSKYKITSTSITADGYNVPNTFAAGTTWSEKVTVMGTVQSGTHTLDSQIVSSLNCAVAGSESIKVPAGTFDTVRASCTDTVGVSELMQTTPIPAGAPITVDVTNWYAKGVGLVKSVRVNNTAGETTTIELTQDTIK